MKKVLLFALCMILLASLCFVAVNTAAADEGGVVYISDEGADSNEGTLANPVKTLRAAYKKINGNGTVVVCGPLTIYGTETYLPSASARVHITAKYGGRTHSSGKLIVGGKLYIGGDMELSDISIEAAPATMFFCCGNNVTFGKGISVSLNGSGSYPYIFGGTWGGRSGATSDNNSFFGYTVQVDSGTWTCVRGGNYRTDSNQPMGFVGDVNVVVNGGTFTGTGSGTDLGLISATSFCGLEGDASLEINGGVLSCGVFATAQSSSTVGGISNITGELMVKINGGEFRGDILAAHTAADICLNGKYELDLLGGNVTRVNRIEGTEKLANGSKADSTLNIHEDINVSGKLEGSITVQNPIAGFADPSVYFYDGWYYYTYSSTYKGKPALWEQGRQILRTSGHLPPL